MGARPCLRGMLLHPGGIIAWLLVGLIAGWLAALFTGGGHGAHGDILIDLIGACIGALLFGLLVEGDARFWGSVARAFVEACILDGASPHAGAASAR